MRGKKLSQGQLDRFLATLRQHGNVTLAAEAAGFERTAAYVFRATTDKDGKPTRAALEFAAAWDAAIAEACDRLEGEAWRRAVEGWEEPVFGRVAKDEDGEIGLIRKYDSGLLSLLLKAHKPDKYRERKELSGPNGGPIEVETIDARELVARKLADLAERSGAPAADSEPHAG